MRRTKLLLAVAAAMAMLMVGPLPQWPTTDTGATTAILTTTTYSPMTSTTSTRTSSNSMTANSLASLMTRQFWFAS